MFLILLKFYSCMNETDSLALRDPWLKIRYKKPIKHRRFKYFNGCNFQQVNVDKSLINFYI